MSCQAKKWQHVIQLLHQAPTSSPKFLEKPTGWVVKLWDFLVLIHNIVTSYVCCGISWHISHQAEQLHYIFFARSPCRLSEKKEVMASPYLVIVTPWGFWRNHGLMWDLHIFGFWVVLNILGWWNWSRLIYYWTPFQPNQSESPT